MGSDDDANSHDSTEYLEATFVLLILALSIFAAHMMEKYHIHWFPESGAIIVIGGIFGFIGYISDSVQVEAASSFNVDIFQLIILPAIIFESGFSLKKKGMFANFKPILLYAVIGTAISTFVVAAIIIFLCTPNGIGDLNDIEALMFGSLISATDPVATLAIFSSVFKMEDHPDEDDAPLLYILVFGESVLNDAVAIVLFTTFEGFKDHVSVDASLVGEIIGNFLYVAICSVLIGVGFGILSALLTKWTMIRQNPKFDLVLLYLCAYGSYFFAAAFELSGLFAIFFAGIVMGHYTWYNLSAFSQLSSPIFFKAIANICEMAVFAFLGMALFGSPEVRNAWSWSFCLSILGAITLGRFVHVLPLTWLANLGRKRKIKGTETTAILYAGLRGALAFALSLKTTSLGLDHSDQIISTTLTIAMFTTLFQGTTTRPLLAWLGLAHQAPEQMETPLLAVSDSHQAEAPPTMLKHLDKDYLRPIFLTNPDISGGHTKKQFSELATGLTQLTYRKKLDTHKQILYDLLLKFGAQDPQDSKTKLQEERSKEIQSVAFSSM